MRWLAFLALVLAGVLPGCTTDDAAGPCSAPDDATEWPDPGAYGVALATRIDEGDLRAWACNASGDMRWMTLREGSCAGPWSWANYAAGAGSPYNSGPSGHYGQCEIVELRAGH